MHVRRPLWLTALACAIGCIGNPDPGAGKELGELSLDGPLPDDSASSMLGPQRFSHREVVERIGRLETNKRVSGLLLRMQGYGGAFARAAELGQALLALRAANKPIHCHFESSDNLGYALMARVCDRISMAPGGLLGLVGLRVQLVYARELLASLGMTAEMLQVGRFKGAADPFTRSDMPAETREAMGALLDDLQSSIVLSVSTGRKLAAAEVAAAMDQGPHTAEAALRLRLIDAIAFDDEARAHAKAAAKAERVVPVPVRPDAKPSGLFALLRALSEEHDHQGPHGPHLVLAHLQGPIHDSEEDDRGDGTGAGPFVKAMRRVADDPDVRAVVLRVDSPGGSAPASDRMWHALRRVAKRKPVIVSIGDMAASGGYYVACAGTRVLAHEASLVGSIGVVGGKIVAEDLARRVGVNAPALSRGKHAGWTSPLSRWSEGERAVMMAALERTYRLFLSRIHDSRGLDAPALSKVAEGRLMSGRRAHEGRLVDELGGLREALALARKHGKLDHDAPIEVWPPQRDLLHRLTSLLSGTEVRSLPALGARAFLAGAGSPAFLGSLLDGEVGPFTALPFGLDVQ